MLVLDAVIERHCGRLADRKVVEIAAWVEHQLIVGDRCRALTRRRRDRVEGQSVPAMGVYVVAQHVDGQRLVLFASSNVVNRHRPVIQ